MIKLDDNLLQELGLGALPPEEKKKMLAHIYETLEMRVGMELAKQMTEAQLSEFEQFINRNDEAGALHWLETNFPHYKQVVADEFEKLKAEIKAVAPQILVSSQQQAQAAAGMPPQGMSPDPAAVGYAQSQQPDAPSGGQSMPPAAHQPQAFPQQPPQPQPMYSGQPAPMQPQPMVPQPQPAYPPAPAPVPQQPLQQFGAPTPAPAQSGPGMPSPVQNPAPTNPFPPQQQAQSDDDQQTTQAGYDLAA